MARILLDTNVVADLMRPEPEPRLLAWFEGQPAGTRYLATAITQAELLVGVAALPADKRRNALGDAVRALLDEDFGGAPLPFDAPAATAYAAVVAARRAAGAPISVEAAQVAAIALHHRLPLATRTPRDYAGIAGLSLIDPWHTTAATSVRVP
jgi:toxin FitB